jgi:hypothetical protein
VGGLFSKGTPAFGDLGATDISAIHGGPNWAETIPSEMPMTWEFPEFAKGGIAGIKMPMLAYASGGISVGPAIFGEAGPEAAVPLPDGRRIPVDLRGEGGMVNNFAFNINTPDADSFRKSNKQSIPEHNNAT